MVNLKPTNYCTAMWNGVRCDGTHDQSWGYGDVVHSVRGESERHHAMWRDGYGGIILDEGPREACLTAGPDFDLAAAPEVLQSAGQTAEIQFAGQLAAVGTWGLLETLAPPNSDWSAVDPQWEMSAGSFKPVEAIFPHSLYPVVNCQCPHCLPGRDFAEMSTGSNA